jgi:hypothetical protein
MQTRSSLIVGVVAGASLLIPGSAHAQTTEVIATGLNNPRGIAIAPNGDLYVAEAGSGGDEFCHVGPTGPRCFGTTGAIVRIDPRRGTIEDVVTGLPSVAGADGSGAGGPHDVSFQGQGNLFVTIGWGGEPDLREELEDYSGTMAVLGRVTADGTYTIVSDIASFENDENPDEDLPDSNPYGVLALPGKTIVADAGANALFEVRANGAIRTLAVFDEQPFPGGPPRDAVPTTVVRGGDGAYYVSQLTGGPFSIGAANVFRVPAEGGDPEVVLSGFTNVIDIAFAPDGSLYVLQIAEPLFNFGAAKLIRVSPDGTRTTLAVSLFAPGGLAIAKDGTIYVTNFSIAPGGGQVIAIRP